VRVGRLVEIMAAKEQEEEKDEAARHD
jgi:hypothetical protein